MNPESEEIVNKFIEAAREYIDIVDRHEELGKEKFLYECLKSLPLIFHYAAQLPNVEPDLEGDGPVPPRRIDLKVFCEYLGEYDASYQVWDPIGEEDGGKREVIYHGLGDDLLDIYYDLLEPLAALDKRGGLHLNQAIWEWKFGFQGHYGYHMASAMKTLWWRMRYWSDAPENSD